MTKKKPHPLRTRKPLTMKEIDQLEPVERFQYWFTERHRIFMLKEAGAPKPWTQDKVMQQYFFTNPYRENDKVTRWFAERFRDDYSEAPEVIFGTICFRWFNRIETGEILLKHDLLENWNKKLALKVLTSYRDEGNQVFTGAFIINSPPGQPKLESIIECIDKVWKKRHILINMLEEGYETGEHVSMEAFHKELIKFDRMGGFMAYEVVCDLRYTWALEHAKDVLTWCNPGPGAIRGIRRLRGESMEDMGIKSNAAAPTKPPGMMDSIRHLRARLQKRLRSNAKSRSIYPPIEMREIEHSLCEFDKYERARLKDGRMKRTYNGLTD